MVHLADPLERLPGVGPTLVRKLHTLGLKTVYDLLFYFPFRYDEYIEGAAFHLEDGSKISVVGTLHSIENIFTRNGKRFTKALFLVGSRIIPVVWFNQPYLAKSLAIGSVMRLNGKVGNFGGLSSLISPERQKASAADLTVQDVQSGEKTAPIGVYTETAGLPSKRIRELVAYVWKNIETFPEEYLPGNIIRVRELISLKEALRIMHFPKSVDETALARSRFSYEEMFIPQLRSVILRNKWKNQVLPYHLEITEKKPQIDSVEESLPYTLTAAQKRVVKEILDDLQSATPMNRLLEGDVGSGKTVVAALAMYGVYLCGYKSILMAPTQILATQHFATIQRVLEPFGVRTVLVVGGNKSKKNEGDVFVGTHALLHQKERLQHVGLTVIDEQHRFGVAQRATLRSKHGLTHVLSMTATPIPRTLALTLYGDLDLSIIDEMPTGRKIVKTRVVSAGKRDEAYEWIRTFIREKGEQVFVVCPFVEPSESSESVKSAISEYERLRTEIFSNFSVGLLHGKMKGEEKDRILQDFRDKKYHILVCTPVVEVGIDIPNASVIIIESAERFGLAQLHQFRGRVGRGGQQAFCLLFPTHEQQEDLARLRSMEDTHSGIELSEIDLRFRGSGNLFGMQQSGRLFFKFADLFNSRLINEAKEDAKMFLAENNDLGRYPLLAEKVLDDRENVEAN